jgi:hypothetical protein
VWSDVIYDPVLKAGIWHVLSTPADGNYRATISKSAVSDGAGNLLESSFTYSFFTQQADANHDRYVNSLDFSALTTNFNKSGGVSFSGGDFNYDGRVNALDFNALAARYGMYLAPPTGSSSISVPLQSAAPMRNLFGETTILTDKLDVLEN